MNEYKDIENKDEHLDSFSSHFREQLRDFSVEVEDDVWSGIEGKIQHKKKRIAPFWWFSGVASVAVALLLFLLLRPSDQSNPVVATSTTKSSPTNKANAVKNEINASSVGSNASTQLARLGQAKVKQNSVVSKTEKENKPDSLINISISNEPVSKSVAENVVEPNADNSVTEKNSSKQENGNELNAENKKIEDMLLAESKSLKTKKTSQKWTLAINAGTGGSASLNLSSEFDNPQSNDHGNNPSGDYSTNNTYFSPISVGVNIRKHLSDRVNIESGIIYTYLHTKLDNSSFDLHYLGVPLNISYTVWKNKRWQFYWSAGATLEKGIRSVYATSSSTKYSSIKGFQWSLQTSSGISYTIKKPIGLYFEPKLSYYFDNNQPISIRTEHPNIVGFQVGLHYDF